MHATKMQKLKVMTPYIPLLPTVPFISPWPCLPLLQIFTQQKFPTAKDQTLQVWTGPKAPRLHSGLLTLGRFSFAHNIVPTFFGLYGLSRQIDGAFIYLACN